MLTGIEIKNFQSHVHTQLKFGPGVNAIVGPSDSGKSAIMRALLWPALNRPLGDGFRSSWGGDTVVTITTSDGKNVTRKRTDKENVYIVDGAKLSAAREVPDQATAVLRLMPVNIQRQMDAPFMLSETAGAVAAGLNEAADLALIDTTLANLARTERETNECLTRAERDANDARKAIPDKERLERLAAQVEEVKGMERALQALESRASALRNAVTELSALPPPSKINTAYCIELVSAIVELERTHVTQTSTASRLSENVKQAIDYAKQTTTDTEFATSVLARASSERESLASATQRRSVLTLALNAFTTIGPCKEVPSTVRTTMQDVTDLVTSVESGTARLERLRETVRNMRTYDKPDESLTGLHNELRVLLAQCKPCSHCGAPANWRERVA